MLSQISDSQTNQHKTNKLYLAIAVVVIVAVGVVAFAAFVNQYPPLHPQGLPIPETIVNENLTVNSGAYVHYNFTVFSENVSPTVRGTFNVSGSDQKIKVYIMDSTNFTSWQDTRNASAYYDSGESNGATITVNLPVGNYVLVYDNTFSATPKNVTTEVDRWYLPD